MSEKKKVDWSKVGRKSRRKGKAHECEIARVLKSVTACEWRTTRNSGRTDLGGDVYSPGGLWSDVMVECKHRKSWEVSDLVLGNSAYKNELVSVLIDWGARKEYSRLVVMVKNGDGLWVMATGRDGVNFVASRPTVLLRCAARWMWNHVGKGENRQGASPVLRELNRWLARSGAAGAGVTPGNGVAAPGA